MTVTLLWAATAPLATAVLREHFSDVEEEMVERYLSLLTSIDALGRYDELYFNPNRELFKGDPLILSTDFSLDEVRAQTLEWVSENSVQAAVFLREQRGIGI
jgi:hypothetical protein